MKYLFLIGILREGLYGGCLKSHFKGNRHIGIVFSLTLVGYPGFTGVVDKVETDYDLWSTRARVNSSFLLTHGTYTQRPRMDALDQPDLEYETVTVKSGFLYGLCKKDFISWVERHNHGLPRENWDEYRLIDAPAWDAEEVYQRYHAGEPINQFLVCWPGRIAEIKFDWDWTVTEDMAATAARALKGGE